MVSVPVRGYGAACIYGVTAAKGRFVIMGDSDESYDFENLDGFMESLRAGNVFVNGNRFKGGIEQCAMPWKNRYVGNPILSLIGRIFFGLNVKDFHCGLRGFQREAFLRCNNCATRMEFASEMLIKASLQGLRIAEVPTKLRKDGRNRPPHLRPWRDGWRHLRLMMLFAPTWTFLIPGSLLLTLGIVITAVLATGDIQLGSTRYSVGTPAYASVMTMLGFQTLFLGIFARTLAVTTVLRNGDSMTGTIKSLFTVEHAIILGMCLTIVGFGLAWESLLVWGHMGFSDLDPLSHLRRVIPAGSLIALGWQSIVQAYFLSTIQISVFRPADFIQDRDQVLSSEQGSIEQQRSA